MLVIYRLCSEGNPDKKRPIWPKMKLVEACFTSVMKAFDCEFHFIIDKPTVELVNLVKTCSHPYTMEILHTQGWMEGNEASYFRQLDIASEREDSVLLLEDDYYFLENAGSKIEKALKELKYITPYDHPGYYYEEKHSYPKTVKIIGDHHWMSIIDTTLTFGVQSGKLIKENMKAFKSHSVWDEHMWSELNETVWCPVPSLATHMETPYIAPCVVWPFQ